MATGSLLVLPRFQAFKNGVFAPGALLNFYSAGTSSRLDTFSDSSLSTPNENPVECNAYGLAGPIYLAPTAYKLVVTDSAGSEIFSQDNLLPSQLATFDAVDPSVCNGRLTLSSGTPVTTSDVTAATTIYWAPYRGNRVALYNSTYSRWELFTFSELSLSLGSDAASLPYDVFAYQSAGTVAIERLAWTTDLARATSITTQNGVLVKSGDPTRRYLGTYRTTTTIGQTEDSLTKRHVWNYYNRVTRSLRVTEATDTWTYSTAAYRQANNNTANQVGVVIGWAEARLDLLVQAFVQNNNATPVIVAVAIGEDTVSSAMSGCIGRATSTFASAAGSVPVLASVVRYPAVGYHTYAWLEYATASGTTTWSGDGAAPTIVQSGMHGSIEG